MGSFTAYEIWAFVIATIGLVVTLLNIVDKWATIKQRTKAPELERDHRISELEKSVERIKVRLSDDRKSIEDLQSSNGLLLKGMLALLDIQAKSDANVASVERISDIQEEMHRFLISKGLNHEKDTTESY